MASISPRRFKVIEGYHPKDEDLISTANSIGVMVRIKFISARRFRLIWLVQPTYTLTLVWQNGTVSMDAVQDLDFFNKERHLPRKMVFALYLAALFDRTRSTEKRAANFLFPISRNGGFTRWWSI